MTVSVLTVNGLDDKNIVLAFQIARPYSARVHYVLSGDSDLALCHWREGSYDEARIHLANALSVVDEDDGELRAILLIRAGMVEVDAQRLDRGLRPYDEAAPLIE